MEISGKVVELLDEKRGSGRNGEWRKLDFILETQDQYPKKVCISVWGDKIDQYALNVGDQINAGINLESREFNGRWYTDVRAWKVDKMGAGDTGSQGESQIPTPPMEAPAAGMPQEDNDANDLPF
ncbi:DUF3127 domain-containing protein [Luteibaculum oceani]|uniref:DUF3127 domain-containing protein n=1 Tax=Luteibaculum oceani TaxID=1294296 RepID=A0A5C6VJ50_9FLAO|nr:DUF3127 domain-containing protein [Luteibaculum oceani]TXC85247.1 DUF3127 domain-containing protein [Luteibaculum oceani]